MDKLDAALSGGRDAQISVIGAMLIDDKHVPLVLKELRPEDFIDGTCRATFTTIRKLVQEGRPVDRVTVVNAMQGGQAYLDWARDAMLMTPDPSNVETYIGIVKEKAMLYRFRDLCDRGRECVDIGEAAELARRISSALSATDRMPMMTGPELAKDFLERLGHGDKPKYLPWGIPAADRAAYAELGDMILLGGYASSGKTLLSITMAMAQARAGYKVGYYSLETKPEKMADRMFSSLAKVPLGKIKTRDLTENDWKRFTEAASFVATECPFDIMRAAGSTVDDITAHAIGRGYQVIYVDYVQLVQAPGVRNSDRYTQVTAASQGLKVFAQSTNTAVVALAQLSRPDKDGKGGKPIPPSMHSFRESGQLEQDADVAFLVYPSDPNDNGSDRVFKVGKNKEGPRPTVELAFHGDIQTMVELEPKPDHSLAAEFSAKGAAIKARARARAALERGRQVEFQDYHGKDEDDPFGDG